MRNVMVLCATLAAVSAGLPSSRSIAQATPSPAEQVRGLYDTAYLTSASLIRERRFEPAPIRFDGTLDLGSCHHDMPEPGQSLDAEVERLAFEMAYFRHTLTARGFDPAYYDKWVKSYENWAVDDFARRHFGGPAQPRRFEVGHIVKQMEALRSVRHPQLPKLTYNLNCNMNAAFPVVLRANPANGRVWFIGLFQFRLCEARRLDPWNRAQCIAWREAGGDNSVPLFGIYKVQGEWPGGRRLQGDRTVEQAVREGRSLVLTVKPE